MTVEAFHRVFKYSYLKGNVNKRVDNCLLNLLKYIRDKSFQRVIKLLKGKSTHKLNIIHDRHNKSQALTVDNVECIEDGSKLLVKGEDGRNIYTVTKQAYSCTDNSCQLQCSECSMCIHQYVCTGLSHPEHHLQTPSPVKSDEEYASK